ncbi:MAG: DUF1190 domain-containing protein [Alphaproteobacteria bacterium]|nr:DUF1190 domain-containing protein [Alphaproteobacteria bacterium]
MKRNNSFKFALLGATALILVACGEAKEEVLAYDSVEDCVKAGEQDEAVCEAEFVKAQNLHNEVAPRYDTANSCQAEFGYNRCHQRRGSSGSMIWMPFMMGYMLAPRFGSRMVATQPLYRTASDPNRYYTGANGRVGAVTANGRAEVAKSQAGKPAVRTRTVARGGFGARAARGRGAGS